VLLQDILPMTLCGCLKKDVFDIICCQFKFIKSICLILLKLNTLLNLEIEGIQMLCKLEDIPAFIF
jgi:hypothetical protein